MADGVSVALVSGGVLFGYAAITGKSPLQAFFYAVRGNDPRNAATTQPISLPSSAATGALMQGSGGGAAAVAWARQQLGKPYALGQPADPADDNPARLDCSGLSQAAWYHAGVKLKNHNTVMQWHEKFNKVPLAAAQPGDLVFFGSNAAPHHVGVYSGNDMMINCPDYGIPCREQSIRQSDLLPQVLQFPAQVNAPAAPGASNTGGVQTASLVKQIGMMHAAKYGWNTGAQWAALDQLWTRESSWNPAAKNPSSGAYGIPQALPASKLPKAGQAPTNDASTQIDWGLRYIKTRYGNPVNAWAHETQNGWY